MLTTPPSDCRRRFVNAGAVAPGRRRLGVAAACFTLLLALGTHAESAELTRPLMRQWSPALWPTGTPVSLFDLIEQGYEVRAYQPGLERSWLYLQKGRKLFRCDSAEHDPAPLACEELVKPF